MMTLKAILINSVNIRRLNIKLFNLLIIIALITIKLTDYFAFNIEVLLGIGLFVVSFSKQESYEIKEKSSGLIVFIGTCFAVIHVFQYSRSFLCIALLMYLLYLIDNYWKKVEFYHIATVFVVLPFFQFFENSISIPLRIQLSDWAVSILKWFDSDTEGSGNLIVFMGKSYLIDTGCAGLKMLKTTLLFAGFYLFIFQKYYSFSISRYIQVSIYLLFVVLNLFSNLIRIIALVIFDVPERTLMHEVVGCCCLVLYILVPAYVLLYIITNNKAQDTEATPQIASKTSKINYIHFLCFVVLLYFFFHGPIPFSDPPKIHLKGLETSKLTGGIIRYSDAKSIIYYKAIPSVFSLEHNPTVCWSVEGFLLKKIHKQRFGNVEVYRGTFEKGGEVVYAAWWFSNGHQTTINNFEWRYKALFYAQKYYFVNVNSLDEKSLTHSVERLLFRR